MMVRMRDLFEEGGGRKGGGEGGHSKKDFGRREGGM